MFGSLRKEKNKRKEERRQLEEAVRKEKERIAEKRRAADKGFLRKKIWAVDKIGSELDERKDQKQLEQFEQEQQEAIEKARAERRAKAANANRGKIIIAASVVVVGLIFACFAIPDSDVNKQTAEQTTQEDTTTTPERTTAPEDEGPKTDIDLLKMSNHPVVFGLVSDAGAWEDYSTMKVAVDSYGYSLDNPPIIIIYSRGNSGIIDDMYFKLEKFSGRTDEYSTLESALDFAREYTDMGVLEGWFDFEQSWCLVDEKNDEKIYHLLYNNKNPEDNDGLSNQYCVIIYTTTDGFVTSIELNDDVDFHSTPDGMKLNPYNPYTFEEWDAKL